MKIYTKTGDEGKTGLLYGGRVWKDDPGPEAYGAVDEAVSALGVARAAATGELAAEILALERDLFVVGAELATDPANRENGCLEFIPGSHRWGLQEHERALFIANDDVDCPVAIDVSANQLATNSGIAIDQMRNEVRFALGARKPEPIQHGGVP